MRSYGIKLAVAAAIVITVLALVLCSSSEDSGKYDGGTLVKACDDLGVEAYIDGASDTFIYAGRAEE